MPTAPRNIRYAERTKTVVAPAGTEINNTPTFERTTATTSSRFTYTDIKLESDDPSTDLVTDREAVIQRILLVLGTTIRTRWRRPRFGTDVEKLLFDPLDSETAGEISSRLSTAISNPHNGLQDIDLAGIEVIPDVDNQQFFCNLLINVPRLNIRNLSIDFGLQAQ